VTLWPDSQRHIETLTEGMDAADRQKVLVGNATRVYGFDT
jgi:predicted TIM-barrel fold metal-dependent hydrolase